MGELGAQSDAALWAHAKAGDGEAFGVLFDRHHGRVRRHAARLLGGDADADDAAAAAFLELWRRRRDVRVIDGSVLPWLLVVTTNVVRNTARSRRRYARFLAALPAPREASLDPFDAMESGLSPVSVRALRALPATDGQLLALVVVADLPIAAAAEATGLSHAAAKSRLHRMRHLLRAELSALKASGPSESAVKP